MELTVSEQLDEGKMFTHKLIAHISCQQPELIAHQECPHFHEHAFHKEMRGAKVY